MRQGLLTWVVWTIGVALGSDGEAADKTLSCQSRMVLNTLHVVLVHRLVDTLQMPNSK